jgi:uncharacterized protein (UPF0335 family)
MPNFRHQLECVKGRLEVEKQAIRTDWKNFLETVKAAGYKITFSIAKNVKKAVEAKHAGYF